MHVGHLRSTVIGDSLARILAALGHRVIRDNHLGDWGSQFGMILWGWKNARDEAALRDRPRRRAGPALSPGPGPDQGRRHGRRGRRAGRDRQAPRRRPREPRALGPVHAPLPGGARRRSTTGWASRSTSSSARASTTPCSPRSSTDLQKKGLAVESEGAIVVFVEETEAPFIVRKRDGAFTYATTDLATIQYRVETWNPDQVLYVVDHRQGDHFKQLFEVARKWGYDSVDLEHVAFGTILGTDRRPFKTREGDVVGLESLLDEAVAEALKVVEENSPELDPEEQRRVAEVVGLGAIKYADLSPEPAQRLRLRLAENDGHERQHRRLTSSTPTPGSRASSARGASRREAIREQRPAILLSHPAERALGVRLLRLPEVLELAASELKPNILTDYLFDLANAFSTFFEECPVLKAESPERRDSRLALCDLTGQDLEIRARPAWNRCRGPDVSPTTTGRRIRRDDADQPRRACLGRRLASIRPRAISADDLTSIP